VDEQWAPRRTFGGVITQRIARVNGIELVVHECGSGKPLVLCHGFPESAYSWRHQMEPLAAAGYHVMAPDQRGYAHSSTPPNIDDYGIGQLTDDLLAMLDERGYDKATFVGHDWGAFIVWQMAQLHPERVAAVVGVSVPFSIWPMQPIPLLKQLMGDKFFYMLYFQQVGPAEVELEADTRATITKLLWSASGGAYESLEGREPFTDGEGIGFLTQMDDMPAELPSWITQADIDHYVAEFEHSGFFGPVSYYRNLDANWLATKDLPPSRLTMPSAFIGGSKDFVVTRSQAMVDAMPSTLPDYRGTFLIEGAGHWTQQEKPEEFNRVLIDLLATF
jgi:pimeloyl-ACP methyl ester carboxylesterase